MGMQIGFTAHRDADIPVQKEGDGSGTLFRFDSGRLLTMLQGTRAVAVLGGIGSGKTTSFVLPMLDNLVAEGFGGLVLDVKGNLRETVRAIAAHRGRLGDVVEFGTGPSACRTDFLDGLKSHELSDLFSSLATYAIGSESINMNFFLRGATIYRDVCRCLADISSVNPDCTFSKEFRPTLAKLFRIVNNFPLAQGLWAFYSASINRALVESELQGEEPPEEIVRADEFANIVRSDNFHVLREAGCDKNDRYREQLSYALSHINGTLSMLDGGHGLLDRFSSRGEDSVPMDFDKLVYRDKKIVLVHFAMDTGRAGEIFSKVIKERYYQSVIRNGLNSGGYTFLVADEFQNIVSPPDGSRLGDADFFSLSRQYRNINIIATQSVASLRMKCGAETAASILANCMTKIALQTSDPVTEFWLSSMRDGGRPLRKFGRGECAVICPDDEGRLADTEDSVNEAHAAICTATGTWREKTKPETSEKKPPWRVGAAGLPYAITKVLLEPYKEPEGRARLSADKGLAEARARYADEIFIKLDRMRDASIAGRDFWSLPEEGRPKYVEPYA